MDLELSNDQRLILSLLNQGLDTFSGCCERGHFGTRLLVLASLRRHGLIDHRDRPIPPAAANACDESQRLPVKHGHA